MHDGKVADTSDDPSSPCWRSRPGDQEPELEIVFEAPVEISSLSVFWIRGDGTETPAAWEADCRCEGVWRPLQLYVTDSYQTAGDRFNVVHPAAPVVCEALRIRMTPQAEKTVGISEVRIE